jgi:hypothetical protein
MDKLNLTKEQVEEDIKLMPNLRSNPKQRLTIEIFAQDWLSLYAELARLNTAIDRARGEIETEKFKANNNYDDDCSGDKADEFHFALEILRKHLGEKK